MGFKKAVMYGAGNIGRGFIGQLLYESGYEVCFIDVNQKLIKQLNTEKEYPVRLLDDDGYEETLVRNVRAVDGNDIDAVAQAIAEADICATAVGVNVLKFTAEPFRQGIIRRFAAGGGPLNIIICENLIGADIYLKKLISEKMSEEEQDCLQHVGFVEASVGRMVPVQTPEMQDGNPLRICTERFCQLPVDRAAFRGEIPPIKNMVPFEPFSYYIERKLFIHNMGHATAAYFGKLAGCEYIWQAMERPEIVLCVLRAMLESAVALSKKYNVPFMELHSHIEDLLHRFSNHALGDTVDRVGGDIKRKLSLNDRLAGAYRLCKEEGVDNSCIALAIAASLSFSREGEPKYDTEEILCEFMELDKNGTDYCRIMKLYQALQEKSFGLVSRAG